MNDINIHEAAFACEEYYNLFIPDFDKTSWWVGGNHLDAEGIDDIYDTKCIFCEIFCFSSRNVLYTLQEVVSRIHT